MADDLYVNNEAAKGAPAAAPREGFKDLSTEHKLLGCLLKNEVLGIKRSTSLA